MHRLNTKIIIDKVNGPNISISEDHVVIEEPLEIQLCSETINSSAAKTISITMRTPGHDQDLAVGFLFGESIIQNEADIKSVDLIGKTDIKHGLQNIVRVTIDPSVTLDMKKLTRHFYTTSSCGVCGTTSIQALENNDCKPNQSKFSISQSKIIDLPRKLQKKQMTFNKTGGLHAAAVFNSNGEIVLVREDIGRHNAVDKVIGSLFKSKKLPANEYGIIVSGRTSFELMQKTIVAGIPMLVAISAPSSLAIDLAKTYDITLIGFLRGEKFNIYSRKERVDC
tara:strand:+ start:9317 stop:10159 length:843 start_codon:yes stop_codon:yes gene_type:complete